MTGLSVLLSGPMSYVFSSNNQELYELTKYAMKIYSIPFYKKTRVYNLQNIPLTDKILLYQI